MYERGADNRHEEAEAAAPATAIEIEGFGEQSARVGREWRQVAEEHRTALVRELLDDVAALRPLEKSRR